MKNKLNALLVAVWSGGNKIQTSCFYDENSNTVHGVEPIDPHEFLAIVDEYVLYKDQIVTDYKFSV